MKIKVEIDVKFDDGFDGGDVDTVQIREEIQSAVCACEGIEDIASVEVTKLKIVHGRQHRA